MSKILPILLQPHPTLTSKAEPVAGATPAVLATLETMLATLYRAEGVGLAAPQIDVRQRLVVMDLGVEKADGKRDYSVKKPQFFINPKIVSFSEEEVPHQEGCLSLPGLWADVVRPQSIVFQYIDRDGQLREETAEGLQAVCVQHEIDHLDGILFTDRLSRLRRDMALKKWKKLREDLVEDGGEFDVIAVEKGLVAAHKRAL
jgi:peptide deformylase